MSVSSRRSASVSVASWASRASADARARASRRWLRCRSASWASWASMSMFASTAALPAAPRRGHPWILETQWAGRHFRKRASPSRRGPGGGSARLARPPGTFRTPCAVPPTRPRALPGTPLAWGFPHAGCLRPSDLLPSPPTTPAERARCPRPAGPAPGHRAGRHRPGSHRPVARRCGPRHRIFLTRSSPRLDSTSAASLGPRARYCSRIHRPLPIPALANPGSWKEASFHACPDNGPP